MKSRTVYIVLSLIGLYVGSLCAQQNPDDYHIYITEKSMEVRDDSLYIDLHIRVKDIHVHADQILILEFSLQSEMKEMPLPEIVFVGKRRERFDKRNRLINGEYHLYQPYCVYKGVRLDAIYAFDYVVNIPFSPWMVNARLELKQIHGNCCKEWEYIQIMVPDIKIQYNECEENKLLNAP